MTMFTATTNGKGDAHLRNGYIKHVSSMNFCLIDDNKIVLVDIANERTGVLNGYMAVPTETVIDLSKQLLKHQAAKPSGYVVVLSEDEIEAVMIAISDNQEAFGAEPQATGKGYERQAVLYGDLFEELQSQTGTKPSDLGELAWT